MVVHQRCPRTPRYRSSYTRGDAITNQLVRRVKPHEECQPPPGDGNMTTPRSRSTSDAEMIDTPYDEREPGAPGAGKLNPLAHHQDSQRRCNPVRFAINSADTSCREIPSQLIQGENHHSELRNKSSNFPRETLISTSPKALFEVPVVLCIPQVVNDPDATSEISFEDMCCEANERGNSSLTLHSSLEDNSFSKTLIANDYNYLNPESLKRLEQDWPSDEESPVGIL